MGGRDVAEVVAAALGVVQRGSRDLVDHLVDALAGTTSLLVLDNCEHLVADVADVVDAILARAPTVRVLATSREPLGARGELVRPLAPLEAPPQGATPDEIRATEAVRLFEARARVVAPRFVVDDEVAPVVARICRRLDGLPLAIELAAARVRMLAPADIELRLHERFTLLTGGRTTRHETLREAIAWSHELLGDDDRRALRRLSVFVSTFDVPAAVAVVGADHDGTVIDVLASLIDRSLLVAETHGDHVRYRMLESVRAFGREQLEDHDELVTTRTRHASQLVQTAVHAGELLHGPREAEGHALLDELRPDLRAAVEWCVLAGRWTDAARVVAAIPWERVGRWVQVDVTSWAVRLLAEDPDLDPVLSARVHGVACVGHWLAGDVEAMRATGDRALALAEGLPDEVYVEVALAIAWSFWEAGEHERATALYLPLATPGLGQRVRHDIAAYCLAGMVMGMVEAGLLDASHDAVELAEELAGAALDLATSSGCPTALSLAHLAEAYRQLDSDPVAAEAALRHAAEVPGLALPSWALHARSHLARLHAEGRALPELASELGALLVEALAVVDELHLRHIAGFVGGALVMAGHADLAPTLRPLTVDAFTVDGGERWRRAVRERLGEAVAPAATTPLGGRELEHAIRTAIDDLRTVSEVGAPG